MSIFIRWFPPSWFQIKYNDKVIYIDPAWMRTLFVNYSKKVEFSKWPDPIDGLPEKDLEKADLILITHHHKDHCKAIKPKIVIPIHFKKKGNPQEFKKRLEAKSKIKVVL